MNKELQEKRYGSRQVTLAALCLQLNTCRRQGIENPTDKRMIGRETNGTTIFNSFQDASDFYDAFDTKNK